MERLTEEPIEERPRRACLEGRSDLAEDLSLPGDHRVETSGDAEEVQRRRLVVKPIERCARRLEQGGGERLGGCAVVARQVELGAVAGREADGLANRRRQLAGHLGRAPGVEGDALPELDRSAVV